jgi:hypothetical protein
LLVASRQGKLSSTIPFVGSGFGLQLLRIHAFLRIRDIGIGVLNLGQVILMWMIEKKDDKYSVVWDIFNVVHRERR